MLKTVGNLSVRTGDQTIVNGNLVIGTAGKGIDFSAGANLPGSTSELLADYEVGTFVTAVTCGTSGTITLDPSYNILSYVKVGDLVLVTGSVIVSSVSSPVGRMNMSLPFTVASLSVDSTNSPPSIMCTGTVAAKVADFVGFAYKGSTNMEIYLGDATTLQADSANEMQTNSRIWVSVSYRAA